MKDINELGLEKDELSEAVDKAAITEDNFSSAVDKTQDYTDTALNDELEKLAQTFQDELKKAQAMNEEELIKNGLVVPQYEDEVGVIPQEELCKCCGEQRRDKSFGENYEYCRACREAMKDYPFSVKSLIFLGITVFLCVLSIFSFSNDFSNYNMVRKADEKLSQHKLFSALEEYEDIIAVFESEGIKPEKLYLKTAEILFNTMPDGVSSMQVVAENVEKALSAFESHLPLNYKYTKMREEVLIMNGTFQEFYTMINSEEYATMDASDEEDYTKIMTDIGALIDKEISVSAIDGTQSIQKANEAAVRFCQYMFAYTTMHYDDCYKYMQEVSELAPEYLWLYAYELGNVKLQKGQTEDAEALADALYELNTENSGAYALYSYIYRMSAQPKKAVEWADKGLTLIPGDTELMRMKAMALIAQGDMESAKAIIDDARANEDYGLLMLVSLVVENELGNKDEVKEIKSLLKENSLEITDNVNDYLKGKISAKQLFTEGVGDVQ